MTTEKIKILNIDVNTAPIEKLIEDSITAIKNRNPNLHFACANPHSAVTAQSDEKFLSALNDAEIMVADGTGISLISRLISKHQAPRITGHDYFYQLLDTLNKKGSGKVFFFGSTEQVLGLIKTNLANLFPNITIAGTLSPPFRDWSEDENDQMIKTINATNPDILWVGMTAPKQEKWVYSNRERITTPVIGSIGAVFDFVAGTHPRAPAWMRKFGLEWLYRLIREPKRMWRRNLISTPKFILFVLYNNFFSKK